MFIYYQETYFVQNSDNKCPKGKLYAKYFNKMRSLKHHGLVYQEPASNNRNNTNIKLTRVTAEFNDELSNSSNLLL